MIHNWSGEQAAAAAIEGWQLVEVWDGRRLHIAIMRIDDGSVFETDREAANYVSGRSMHENDPLCRAALAAMMQHQMGGKR